MEKAPMGAPLSPTSLPTEGKPSNETTVGALGILGLVCAVSLPAASAAVLLQDDFSTDKLLKDKATYMEGSNPQTLADPANPLAPFFIPTDQMVTDGVAQERQKGWLSTVSADTTAGSDLNEDDTRTVPELLLFGDPTWTDVAIQARIVSRDQTTGAVSLVLRAAPKTKDTDANTRYELRYQSDVGTLLSSEQRDNIPANDTDTSVTQDGSTVVPISLRILKVVNGKWTQLAQQDAATSKVHIPLINNAGVDHDAHVSVDGDDGTEALTGGYFRFVAKGDQLTGFVSLDGKTWSEAIKATDSEIKAGRVGFMQYDYIPLFDDLLVQDAKDVVP